MLVNVTRNIYNVYIFIMIIIIDIFFTKCWKEAKMLLFMWPGKLNEWPCVHWAAKALIKNEAGLKWSLSWNLIGWKQNGGKHDASWKKSKHNYPDFQLYSNNTLNIIVLCWSSPDECLSIYSHFQIIWVKQLVLGTALLQSIKENEPTISTLLL